MRSIQSGIRSVPDQSISHPVFPAVLAAPLAIVPSRLHSAVIVRALNLLLAEPLQEGELDFLEGQQVSVEISDMKLRFALGLENEKLIARTWRCNDALNLKGQLHDFLLLATRQEDADTLFFQRRLKMQGSTDLGLEVKNLLDGMDLEAIRFHQPINGTLKQLLSLYERWL